MTPKDTARIRKAYAIPNNVTIRILGPNNRIKKSDGENEVCVGHGQVGY